MTAHEAPASGKRRSRIQNVLAASQIDFLANRPMTAAIPGLVGRFIVFIDSFCKCIRDADMIAP
jgi:hypothetical protein